MTQDRAIWERIQDSKAICGLQHSSLSSEGLWFWTPGCFCQTRPGRAANSLLSMSPMPTTEPTGVGAQETPLDLFRYRSMSDIGGEASAPLCEEGEVSRPAETLPRPGKAVHPGSHLEAHAVTRLLRVTTTFCGDVPRTRDVTAGILF